MNDRERDCRIIPVDLGVRNIATTIENGVITFYGAEVNRIRRKYPEPHPGSGTGTCLERWSAADRKEARRRVREAARQIISIAKNMDAVIAIGNPRTSRQPRKWGVWCRTYWPIISFTQYLKAKAETRGVRILEVPENCTSQTCSRCGARGLRRGTVFVCAHCKLTMNADANAALNIGERARDMLARTNQPPSNTLRPSMETQHTARTATQISSVVCRNVY